MKERFFDLDGTLLDSMNVWRKIDVDFLGNEDFRFPGLSGGDYPFGNHGSGRLYHPPVWITGKQAEIIEEWLSMARDAYANTVPFETFLKKNIWGR